MKKITKKEVKKIWGDCFKTQDNYYLAKSYIYNDKLQHAYRLPGEGLPVALFYNDVPYKVNIGDIIEQCNDCYKVVYIDTIYNAINEMIEDYNNKEI